MYHFTDKIVGEMCQGYEIKYHHSSVFERHNVDKIKRWNRFSPKFLIWETGTSLRSPPRVQCYKKYKSVLLIKRV